MRKTVLSFMALLAICVPLFPDSAGYRTFFRYLRARDYSASLRVIRKLHRRESGLEKYRYWYGYTLYRLKRYRSVVRILSTENPRYRPLSAILYLGLSCEKTGQYRKGIRFLEWGLRQPEKKDGYKHHLFSVLARLLKKAGDTAGMGRMVQRASQYYRTRSGSKKGYVFYNAGRLYYDRAIRSLGLRQWSTAFSFYKKCIRIAKMPLGKYGRYLRPERFVSRLIRLKKYRLAKQAAGLLPDVRANSGAALTSIRATYASGARKSALKQLTKLIRSRGETFTASDWWYAVGVYNSAKRWEALLRLEQRTRAAYRRAGKPLPQYLFYRFTKTRYNTLFRLIRDGNDRTAYRRATEALRMYRRLRGKYRTYIRKEHLTFLQKSLRYWLRNGGLRKRAYRHRFLVVVYSDTATRIRTAWGGWKSVRDRLSSSMLPQYRASLETMRRVFFYLTRGRVDFNFDLRYFKGTITAFKRGDWNSKFRGRNGRPLRTVPYFMPVLDSIHPSPGRIFFRGRNRYDSFIHVFPSRGLTKVSTGGMGRMMFVPGMLHSRERRGRINIAGSVFSDRSYRLLAHEFFHSVEASHRKLYSYPAHIWRKRYRSFWPGWYSGAGELPYYEMVFRRYLRPRGMHRLHFRSRRSPLSNKDFRRVWSRYRQMGRRSVSRLSKQLSHGNAAYYKREYRSAFRHYLSYFNRYPENGTVCRRLAYLYYRRGNRRKMKEFYIRAGRAPGATPKDVRRAARYDTTLRGRLDRSSDPEDIYRKARREERRGRHERAVRLYRGIVQKSPHYRRAAYSLYRMLYIRLRYQKQYRIGIREAVPLFPKIRKQRMARTCAFYIGRCYGELKQKGKAIHWLRLAGKLGYSFGTVRGWIRRYSK